MLADDGGGESGARHVALDVASLPARRQASQLACRFVRRQLLGWIDERRDANNRRRFNASSEQVKRCRDCSTAADDNNDARRRLENVAGLVRADR